MKKKIVMFIFLVLGLLHLPAVGEVAGEEQQTVQSISLADAPLSQVLTMLEELTDKPILRDSGLPAVSIDLQIRNAMTKSEAIRAVESALALNHIAIVELGDGMLKAVSAKLAPAQAPNFIEGSLLGKAPSEKICSKLFQLEFISVGDFSKLVTKLLNPELSAAITFEDSNSILITDSLSTLQRVELILSKVDVPKHSVTESKIFRVKHGEAKEIAELLKKVIEGPQGGTKPGDTPAGVGVSDSTFRFSKNLSVEHDVRSNSVIVCGTPKDIEQISSIIDQIDVLLDQVRIEVVIAQVMLKKGQASGLDSLGLTYNVNGAAVDGRVPVGGNDIGISVEGAKVPEQSQGILSVNGNLKKFAMSTVFGKAKTDSNVQILSAPTIVTTHNREALIKIADSIPIISSEASDTTNLNATKTTIEYKDIGIELKVKPLIGVNGIIQLEINQHVETQGTSVTIHGVPTPMTVKRDAVSFVSVYDGDTVVLAGLQEKKTSRDVGKVWLLGDLPIIGKLFSPKSRKEETTELIIFIKPTIVLNPANEEAYAKKLLDSQSMASVREEVAHYNEAGKFLPMSQFSKNMSDNPDKVDGKSGADAALPIEPRSHKKKHHSRIYR